MTVGTPVPDLVMGESDNMRKLMVVLVAIMLASLGMAGAAFAQDPVIGVVTADPATVPEAGEHTFTASGSGYIPDTTVLVGSCTSPADPLVPGESDIEAITAAAGAIDPLSDCDIATAQSVDVDSDGNWTVEVTAEVGPNFFLTAGALDGSQGGAAWIPIVPAGGDLADTGVETGLMAVIGIAVLGAGVMVAREARRLS